jgi:AAA domain
MVCFAPVGNTHTPMDMPMSNRHEDRPIGFSNSVLQTRPRSIPWIWEGVIAERAVTLLSAPEKIGKTTLLSLLLDRRRAGGELLGRTIYPGRTILCSEEEQSLWALRQPPLDFGPELIFHCPLGGAPSRGRWRRFINECWESARCDGPFELLVIDTAVAFMPLFERNKRTLRRALEDLHTLTLDPIGVLIVNQSRSFHRPLAAFADIVIEMAIPRGNERGTRKRTITGVGRYPGTLQSVTAELNADGTDYVLGDDCADRHPPLLTTLQALLGASPTPLTSRELLERWPGDAPRQDSLLRTLARGIELGLFSRSGTGTKSDPYRVGMVDNSNPQTTGLTPVQGE